MFLAATGAINAAFFLGETIGVLVAKLKGNGFRRWFRAENEKLGDNATFVFNFNLQVGNRKFGFGQ